MARTIDELEQDLNTLFGRSEGLRMLLQLLLMQHFTALSKIHGEEVAQVAIREFRENIERNKNIFSDAFETDEAFRGLEAALTSFDSAVRDASL